MATSAGRILLIPKGNYDAATTYQPLDIVFYNNASYVCKATTLGNAPTNTTYWQIFSEGFDVEQFYANIAPTYNAATTYAAGDHFIYNDVIYTVNVACTGITPPNANYYSVATITGLIEDNTAAISSLNSNVENCALLTQISNPNLLDNPWFTVNQRGESSYSSSSYSSSGEYTFDRWNMITDASGGSVSKSNNVITIALASGSSYVIVRQILEDYSFLEGITLTMSVLMSDGTIYQGTAQFIDSSSNVIFYSGTDLTLRFYNDGSFQVVCKASSISIRAVKLEVGSVSTLAMDTAPNYATELLKCQRYYQRIFFFEHNILTTSAAYDHDYYVTPKRTNGSLTAYSAIGTANKVSFYTNSQWEDNNYDQLEWDAGSLNTNIRLRVTIPANSYVKGSIEVSADL